jgi:hypothetical protein
MAMRIGAAEISRGDDTEMIIGFNGWAKAVRG